MKTTINTKDHGKVTFFVQCSGGYVWVDLNGKPGTLGKQICQGGYMTGSTLSHNAESQADFDRFCRNWWAAHLRNYREMR